MHLVPFFVFVEREKDVVREGAWHNSLPEIPSAVDQEREGESTKARIESDQPRGKWLPIFP